MKGIFSLKNRLIPENLFYLGIFFSGRNLMKGFYVKISLIPKTSFCGPEALWREFSRIAIQDHSQNRADVIRNAITARIGQMYCDSQCRITATEARCIVIRNTGSQPEQGRCIVIRNAGSQPE